MKVMIRTGEGEKVRIPSKEDEITAPWFSQVTQVAIKEPNTFKILQNKSTNAGNLSQMIRIQFEEEGSPKNFIVKLLPAPKTDFERNIFDIIVAENMDGREVFFYKKLKSDLGRIVPELDQYFLKHYHATKYQGSELTKEASLLIFKDMTPLGYRMPTFASGLSSHHFDQALIFVAKFHFAGEMLQSNRTVGLWEIYPELKGWQCPASSEGNLIQKFPSLSWFAEGLTFAIENLLRNSEPLASSISALIPIHEKIISLLVEAGRKYPTIVHDDLWPHNFLCHENGDIKVIDWQLIGFTDPVYDLASFLLSTSPIQDISKAKLTKILNLYYEIKEKLYDDQGLRMERSLDDFQRFFWSYGLSYSLLWFAMSCDSIYATESYRPKLLRIFQFLGHQKVPEFLQASISSGI